MDARVLLVEDDPSIRETTAMGLRAAGFVVDAAANGRDGLVRFRAERPDVVVLDVMLPLMSGLEVCRLIRAESSVPVLMLTARSETDDVVLGLEAGADDYVRKPFAMAELIARLGAALRRAQRSDAGDRLVLANLEIDPVGYTVRRDGQEIQLSNTEFRLLLELAQRPGQVFTRELLLERVWGYDYLGDSRLVDVAVQRMRAKIETDPAHPAIVVTVRGAGYKAVR
jgi:two-component system, OmpR family, response regulator MtrA